MKSIQFIDIANAPDASDEELYLQFLKDGDRNVLATLFRRHMALVFGLCKKYLLEKESAKDATMDIFERLMGFEPKSEIKNFRGYLYVMSRNYCLMKQRGEKVYLIDISTVDVESSSEMHPIDQESGPASTLLKCLKELKDFQHDCIQLFYMKKKSYLEISSSLKLPIAAVKSHIQNGKRNLKICIEAKA